MNKNPNPKISKILKSIKSPHVPKALTSPKPILITSMKYVSGDIKANGADEIGINNGLMKTIGNFIKMVRIIVLAGVSVGGTDNIKLKLEYAKAAIIIPMMMIKIFI